MHNTPHQLATNLGGRSGGKKDDVDGSQQARGRGGARAAGAPPNDPGPPPIAIECALNAASLITSGCIGECPIIAYTVSMDVPQGSILGLFLFLFYINDLPYLVKDEHWNALLPDDASLLFNVNKQQPDFDEIRARATVSRDEALAQTVALLRRKYVSPGRNEFNKIFFSEISGAAAPRSAARGAGGGAASRRIRILLVSSLRQTSFVQFRGDRGRTVGILCQRPARRDARRAWPQSDATITL
ncbi:hypothetical protein EVAR_66883_1 [Eumeta japonica]|uniref:Reverse transcriptase domain-containing protein n=1 Tax=Eumeta variegata TaxID=151549 RepID=A0A4C2A1P5_EUMVA|nr:hypothetical protein EVAR_66883_1 [Eumeta japonica]